MSIGILSKAKFGKNDENDMDRMRKKQAEFLIKHYVPVSCIAGIIVKTMERETYVKALLERLNLPIKVHVDSDNKYFYPRYTT